MTHQYTISGMTCQGCVQSVKKHLSQLENVEEVTVDLENGSASVTMTTHIPTAQLAQALPDKYQLSEKQHKPTVNVAIEPEKSKWQQLKPLFLILLYISVASNLIHYQNWNISEVMLDFMGLFFIVFSFFKMLDLKGFPDSFRMYDPLAKRVPFYAKIYPFIETALGIMFLMRIEITIALVLTLVILGITTIGVTRTLLDKRAIRCACLGTALDLPMTEATFIENAIMLVMALMLLFQTGVY